MKSVAETTRVRIDQLPKINYLVLSCGILTSPLAWRTETIEGLDWKLALHYYTRCKFIDRLLPSIGKANNGIDEARVMTVMAAGRGGNVDSKDLGLKKNYSIALSATACATYNDLSVKVLFS